MKHTLLPYARKAEVCASFIFTKASMSSVAPPFTFDSKIQPANSEVPMLAWDIFCMFPYSLELLYGPHF